MACGCPTCLERQLGALDPSAAAAQVTTKGVTSSGRAAILASAERGMLLDNAGNPAYIPGSVDCAASGVSGGARDLALVGSGGQLALQGAIQTGLISAGPATLGITIAIAGIVGIFSTILNHHAQAVKKEQSILCSAVPAANNYLAIIDQGVQSGLATPQQGIAALSSLLSGFTSAVSSIAHDCNAACVMTEELEAVVLVKQSEYQDLIAAQQAAPVPVPAAPQPPAPVQVIPPSRPNTTQPVATVPASSYAGFYSPTPPAPAPVPAPPPDTTQPSASSYAGFYSAAPTPASASAAVGVEGWLPVAAALAAGFLLTRLL